MIYIAVVSAVLIILIYMSFEAGFVELNEVKFTKNKNCLKILHMSDIHINLLKVPVNKVLGIVRKVNPDIIILSGDYIDKPVHINEFLKFLFMLTKNCQVFMCLGNHDYNAFKDSGNLDTYIKSIENSGAVVLHNKSICYEKNSKKYNIIGIEDVKAGNCNVKESLNSCCSEAFMNIAFSHNPDVVLEIPNAKVDYLFCGHFHGGQIWMPFNLEFKILRRERLCKMGIRKGLHKVNGINLYINRGLGNVCFPLRFLSRPEITVYYLP